jgi:hypothetical protein
VSRTFKWTHGTVRAHLLRVDGTDGVPFDVSIDGAVTPSATLANGSHATTSRNPARIVSATGPSGQTASFSLVDGHWTPVDGTSSAAPQLALTLGWPQVPGAGRLSVPLFALRSRIAYERDFISARLDTAIDGSLQTSVRSIAGWVRTRRWLPPAARAASVAVLLARSARTLTRAYGAVPRAVALAPEARGFLDHAGPLARTLGLALPRAEATGISPKVAAAGRGLVARIADAPAGAARAKGVPSPSKPPGLRGTATVGRLRRHALSHGAWRRPPRSTARSAARRLAGHLGFRTRVAPLWTSARRVRRGGRIAVLAGRLVRHGQVAVTVAQRHGAREAALRTRRGVAGAVVQLPENLRRGRAWLAVSDFHAARHRGATVTVATAPIAVR